MRVIGVAAIDPRQGYWIENAELGPPMFNTAPRVLLIEDDEIQAVVIEENLSSRGFSVITVPDAEQAWEILEKSELRFNAILLDRELPGMGGIDLLRKIRAERRFDPVPVILETATADPSKIQEGLNAGAYYYLTKPFEPAVLIAIVTAAIQQFSGQREAQEDADSLRQSLAFVTNARFVITTLDEAHTLAAALAQLCPDPRRAHLGLQELLVNAVEHGNLGITYDEKTDLMLQDRLQLEWQRRLDLPENAGKSVEIVFERRPEALFFTIRDHGSGFDWEKYLDFDLERILDPNGKGIAMARRNSFDSLEYLGNGNTVVASVALART